MFCLQISNFQQRKRLIQWKRRVNQNGGWNLCHPLLSRPVLFKICVIEKCCQHTVCSWSAKTDLDIEHRCLENGWYVQAHDSFTHFNQEGTDQFSSWNHTTSLPRTYTTLTQRCLLMVHCKTWLQHGIFKVILPSAKC